MVRIDAPNRGHDSSGENLSRLIVVIYVLRINRGRYTVSGPAMSRFYDSPVSTEEGHRIPGPINIYLSSPRTRKELYFFSRPFYLDYW